jgi:hypothetical protein
VAVLAHEPPSGGPHVHALHVRVSVTSAWNTCLLPKPAGQAVSPAFTMQPEKVLAGTHTAWHQLAPEGTHRSCALAQVWACTAPPDLAQVPPEGPEAVTRACEQMLSQPKSKQLLSPGMVLLAEQLLLLVQLALCWHSKVAVHVRPAGAPHVHCEQPGSVSPSIATGVENPFHPTGHPTAGAVGLRAL